VENHPHLQEITPFVAGPYRSCQHDLGCHWRLEDEKKLVCSPETITESGWTAVILPNVNHPGAYFAELSRVPVL
jgi:hypothetical protein